MEVMSHSSKFLFPPPSSADNELPLKYALVVLNQRLPRFTPLLWDHEKLRVCADGGANRLYDDLPELFPHDDTDVVRNRYKPDVIKGDLDSVRQDVLDFYTKLLCILVAGATGGRFDHEIGNINVVCRFSSLRIVLLSDDCIIFLLPKTHRHEILVQPSIEGPHCGLIPIGMPSSSTTTTGLQWNLNDTEMRFGGLISTSNITKEEKITVQSDTDLLWTISVKKL